MPEALQIFDALLVSFGRCHSFPRFATVNDCRVHLEFAKDPEDWTLDILTPMDSWEKSLCTFDALTMFDLFFWVQVGLVTSWSRGWVEDRPIL